MNAMMTEAKIRVDEKEVAVLILTERAHFVIAMNTKDLMTDLIATVVAAHGVTQTHLIVVNQGQ